MSSNTKPKKKGFNPLNIIQPILLITAGSSAFVYAFHNPFFLDFIGYQSTNYINFISHYSEPLTWDTEAKIKVFATSLQLIGALVALNIFLVIVARNLFKQGVYYKCMSYILK